MMGECWMLLELGGDTRALAFLAFLLLLTLVHLARQCSLPHKLLIESLIGRSLSVSLSNSERTMALLVCSDDAPCPDLTWECVFRDNSEGEC